MQDQYDWGRPVSVDIFVMAEGEPADRAATKIGGLPFRPAAAPWTNNLAGEPMFFLGQFNFKQSKDLTEELPGELLLVFADSSSGMTDDLYFEWQPDRIPVLADDRSIARPSGFDPCYGYVYRTLSYPGAHSFADYDSGQYPKCRGKDVWSDYYLRQWQATQIGSAPFFIQGDPELPGRILCAISSVMPDVHEPFPWINHPEPLMPKDQLRFNDNPY
jgi:hypothetical protein